MKDDRLVELVRELFDKYLNVVEESDSGRLFHPVFISCCRVSKLQPLNNLLTEMAELVGTHSKITKDKND